MKRLLSVVLAFGCIALCVIGFRQWIAPSRQVPLAAFISTEEGALPADLEQVRLQLEQDGYRTDFLAACGDLQAATEAMVKKGAQVIVYRIAGNLPDLDFTASARKHNVSMIFAGQAPVRALNTQYDKIWYLGSSVDDAGEQLGQQVATAFRDGTIADRNGNRVLDRLVLSDDSATAEGILSATAWECELYGVSHADCTALPQQSRRTERTAEELAAQWAALPQRPEVIFCIGSEYALLAEQAAAQLGWFDGEAPVWLAAVAESRDAAEALLQSPVYCGMIHYDKEAEMQALYTMTVNLLEHRDISYETGLRRDVETPRFDLPYLKADPAPAASEPEVSAES